MFVGEDLDVLLELCDRILVLCGGQVSGIVDARTTTKGRNRPDDDQSLQKRSAIRRVMRQPSESSTAGAPCPHCQAGRHRAARKAWLIRSASPSWRSGGRAASSSIAVTKLNPFDVYAGMFDGAFGSKLRILGHHPRLTMTLLLHRHRPGARL